MYLFQGFTMYKTHTFVNLLLVNSSVQGIPRLKGGSIAVANFVYTSGSEWKMSNLPEIFSSVRHFAVVTCSPGMKASKPDKPGVELIANSRTEAVVIGFQNLDGYRKQLKTDN